MPPVQTLNQWAAERGLTTTADVQAHIHAGMRCRPTSKTYARFYDKTLRRLQDERDATARAYRAAIDAGEIREPTQQERLERNAQGHPDNKATHAAQRVLERRRQRQQEGEARG